MIWEGKIIRRGLRGTAAEILKSVLCVFHDTYCSKAALQKLNHKTSSKKDKGDCGRKTCL